MFKRLLGIMTSVVIAFGLVGGLTSCGGNAWGDKTRIVFWSPPFVEKETRQWLEKWTNAFNDQDEEYYVDLEFIAQDAWDQTMKAAQANGSAPQITFASYADVMRKSVSGIYKPLDEYIEAEYFEDLYGNIEDMVKGNGKHYIYPAFTEPYSLLFYRKSMLSAKGIAVPQSWNDMYEAAKKLTVKNGVYGAALPGSAQLGYAIWGTQAQSGGYLLNDNWDTSLVDSAFNRSLFEFWNKMYKEELTPKVAFDSYNVIAPLAQGKVAMQMCGSWAIGQIKNDYPDILSDIGIAACPTIDGVTEGVTTAAMGGWGMAIDGNAKNPEAAAKFIKYLLGGDEQIMLEFFKSTGYSKMSGRKSVDEFVNADPEASADPFRKFISEKIVPFALPEPIYIWEISADFATALESTYLSGVTIDKAIKDLDNRVKSYIDENELAGKNPRFQA